MLTFLFYFLLLLLAAVAAVFVIAARRPDTFRVERSVIIAAAPEAIYPHIADLRAWRLWSPYERRDPDMQRTFEGAEQGKGAVYRWTGNKQAGAGRMEILDAAPERLVLQLDFERPFEANNFAEFLLAPHGDGTRVTWAVQGPQRLVGRALGLLVDMDRLIGRDFEEGLVSLKAVVER